MADIINNDAKSEIAESLSLSIFCMHRIGFSFDKPSNISTYFRQKLLFLLSVSSISYHVFSEIVFIGLTLWNSPRVEDVVPLIHTFGYGALSIAKVFVLWYKKNVFGQLLRELADIWPMPPLNEDVQNIKNKSLTALHIAHQWYFVLNLSGVWFYNLTPIGIYVFRLWQGQNANLGYVWVSWYPFDKHKPLAHAAVYIFEIFAGQTCVWIMICTDLLFSGMASHIGMLLRLLQRRLESLALTDKSDDEYYADILSNIKLHQRLIRYCNNLEEAFSLVNLINIVLSSINICCSVFVIVLLEPFMAISNKLFLGSALIQIFVICWYADDIYHAGQHASAISGSRFLQSDVRRAVLSFELMEFKILCGLWCCYGQGCRLPLERQASQKPIAFTAMKFTNISLVTYSAILTRSYSYFALLYTMYSDN